MSPSSFFILPQFVDKLMLPSELTSYTSIFISTAVIAVLVGIISLVNSSHPPLYRVGKSWFFSLVSGRNAMTFTIEKHVQEGYVRVSQQCKLYLDVHLTNTIPVYQTERQAVRDEMVGTGLRASTNQVSS